MKTVKNILYSLIAAVIAALLIIWFAWEFFCAFPAWMLFLVGGGFFFMCSAIDSETAYRSETRFLKAFFRILSIACFVAMIAWRKLDIGDVIDLLIFWN